MLTFFALGQLWIQVATVITFADTTQTRPVASTVLRLLAFAGLLTTGLWATGNALNQTLQDKAAGTVVIRVRPDVEAGPARAQLAWLTELMLKSGMRSGGHDRAVEVLAELPAECANRRADLGGAGEQVDRALVEAEVVGRPDDGAVLDDVDAVAGEAGHEQRRRIDLADVPQAGQQQPPLGAGHHVVDRPAVVRPRSCSTRLSM